MYCSKKKNEPRRKEQDLRIVNKTKQKKDENMYLNFESVKFKKWQCFFKKADTKTLDHGCQTMAQRSNWPAACFCMTCNLRMVFTL